MELHCTYSSRVLSYIVFMQTLIWTGDVLQPKKFIKVWVAFCPTPFSIISRLMLPLALFKIVFVLFKKSFNYHTPINCYLIVFQHFIVICICKYTFCIMKSMSEILRHSLRFLFRFVHCPFWRQIPNC